MAVPASDCQRTSFSQIFVGAIIDRPPKNYVFRIFRRIITGVSPCGDGFCINKIRGRSMIAPTTDFFDTLKQERRWPFLLFLYLIARDQAGFSSVSTTVQPALSMPMAVRE